MIDGRRLRAAGRARDSLRGAAAAAAAAAGRGMPPPPLRRSTGEPPTRKKGLPTGDGGEWGGDRDCRPAGFHMTLSTPSPPPLKQGYALYRRKKALSLSLSSLRAAASLHNSGTGATCRSERALYSCNVRNITRTRIRCMQSHIFSLYFFNYVCLYFRIFSFLEHIYEDTL